jgi:hypothetical protein
MAEGEADAVAQSPLNAPDLSKRLPRIGAFVVAVLEDDTPGPWAANVIDLVVEWLDPTTCDCAFHPCKGDSGRAQFASAGG